MQLIECNKERNTKGSSDEARGSTHMGEVEIVLTEEDLPNWDNFLKYGDSHDGNITWEWVFRQNITVGIKPPKVDSIKKGIMLDVLKDANHACNQMKADHRTDDQKIKSTSKMWEILLDSQSACDVIVSSGLVTIVMECKWVLRLQTQLGEFKITKISNISSV